MKQRLLGLMLCAGLVAGGLPAYASDDQAKGNRPLTEAFNRLVVVPYDFHGKAFVRGVKTDVYGDYEMAQRNGRVLVPIRLMGYLADQVAEDDGYWQVNWDQQKPDEVVLFNGGLKRSIVFTVGSKTMRVNKENVTMDVAPQRIEGRIMLPLRVAAEALEKRIDWLDGLILIGDETVDLKHPQTLAAKDKIEGQLADRRERLSLTQPQQVTPVTKRGNTAYYVKTVFSETSFDSGLYRIAEGGKETRVELAGKPALDTAKRIGGDLYYATQVSGASELHAYDFAANKARKIASLGEWQPADGWLTDVIRSGSDLYVTLHYGDLTMGSDTIYRVDNGSLKKLSHAKSLIRMQHDGEHLYLSDFKFMSGPQDNLLRLDPATGESTKVGVDGFAYGIHREIGAEGGVSYRTDGTMDIRDGFLYTLGYRESDPQDRAAVYRIDLGDGTHEKLTPAADRFWTAGDAIYYVDSDTGSLMQVGLDGKNERALTQRRMSEATFLDGSLYYKDGDTGYLYRFDLASGTETKLSDKTTHAYAVGKNGVYYVSNGYEPGLYKAEADGRNTAIVRDNVELMELTDEGVVYTLVYEKGVYTGA